MRVYKRSTKTWTVEFADHNGKKRRQAAFSDKRLSEALGAKLLSLVQYRKAGQPLNGELAQWLQGLEPRWIKSLVSWGLVNPTVVIISQPLKVHIADYKASLVAKDASPKHIRESVARFNRIIADCRWKSLNDIDNTSFIRWLNGERETGKSATTLNASRRVVLAFLNWCCQDGRLQENPLRYIAKANAQTDVRRNRRPLFIDELRTLLQTTAEGPTRFGMTGPERALLYRLASETGLRWSELKSLTVGSLSLASNPARIRCEAKHTKNRKVAILPLRRDTTQVLLDFVATNSKAPTDRLFGGWVEKGARMLRADLKDADIPYVTIDGYADFHSLRHGFVSSLTETTDPKTAQTLARHSSAELTVGRYSHTTLARQLEVIESLPSLDDPKRCTLGCTPNGSQKVHLESSRVSEGDQEIDIRDVSHNKEDPEKNGTSVHENDGATYPTRTGDLLFTKQLLVLLTEALSPNKIDMSIPVVPFTVPNNLSDAAQATLLTMATALASRNDKTESA